jgi:hypothetical protein
MIRRSSPVTLFALLLTFWSSSAWAIGTVQATSFGACNNVTANPATCSVSFGTLPTVGNTVIVKVIAATSTAVPTVTISDNQGNSYASPKDYEVLNTSRGNYLASTSAPVATSSGTFTVTASLTNPTNVGIYIRLQATEYSGLATSQVIRTYISNISTSNGTTVDTSPAVAQNGELVIALARAADSPTYTNQASGTVPSSGWTEDGKDTIGAMESIIVSSTVAVRHEWTLSTSQGWMTALVVYKASGEGPLTYYLDPAGADTNVCSAAFPCLTWQHAADLMRAGDTTIVNDGTYGPYGQGTLVNFIFSGTASAPITMIAAHSRQAVLSSNPGCSPQIELNGSYLVIQGFKLQIDASDVACGSYNSIVGLGIFAQATALPNINGPPTSGAINPRITDVWIPCSTHRAEGIKSQMDGTIIENSTICDGLEQFNGLGAIYRKNEVYCGELFQGVTSPCVVGKGGTRNFQVYNNTLHLQGAAYLGLTIGGSGTSGWWDGTAKYEAYNSVGYNNVVINETGVTPTKCWSLMGAKDSLAMNNVCIDGTLNVDLSAGSGAKSVNPTFKNNIIATSGGACTQNFSSTNYTGTLTVDYNNFFNCTGPPVQVHPIVGDPLFANRLSSWHLIAGSTALGAGTPVTVTGYNGEDIPVNLDVNGVARQLPWSLGLYNYAPYSPAAGSGGCRCP